MVVDFHGITLDQLPKELDKSLHRALLYQEEIIEFITGTGVLQDALVFRLRTIYDYLPRYKLGNVGSVIVDI